MRPRSILIVGSVLEIFCYLLCFLRWISRRRHSVLGLSVCSSSVRVRSYTESLETWYLTSSLWEFYQIYNLGAVRGKDEVMRFWDQTVKGQHHSETKKGSWAPAGMGRGTCRPLEILQNNCL